MLRHAREYKEMQKRLDYEQKSLQQQIDNLTQLGLTTQQIEQALAPAIAYCQHLSQEIEYYENIKRGEFGELRNLGDLGKTLISIRIALGISQKELAQRLHVSEGQISKDERQEYHGVTLEKAQRILDALGVTLSTKVELAGPQSLQDTPAPDPQLKPVLEPPYR